MMIATILSIPMPIIVSIAVYMAGIWITAVYLGAAGYDDDTSCIVISSVLWPLFMLAVCITNLDIWLRASTRGCYGERAKTIAHRIRSVLHYISLPCRPFLVGRMLKKCKDGKCAQMPYDAEEGENDGIQSTP